MATATKDKDALDKGGVKANAKSLSGRPVFVLVDGYSLLYRAFFATPNLRTSDGRPTNALYGFANMVLRLMDEYKPVAAAVAWDPPVKTFRKESFADYKAHRPEQPDDLSAQVGPVLEMIKALALPLVEVHGYEADDVIGTLSCRAAEEGYEVYIVTGDTDALQLVSEHVRVVQNLRGVSDVIVYDVPKVEERYGLRVDQVVDWKALKGDTSDNIPGVAGIGEKTATKLIAEFGDLDALYENLDKVTPDRIRNLLAEGRDSAFMSRDLSRIHCDIPIKEDPAQCVLQEPDAAAARDFFSHWQMRSLEARFAGRVVEPEPELEDRDAEYRVAESAQDIADFAKGVAPGCLGVALDTDPFSERHAALRGVALSSCEGSGLYVPISHASPGTLDMGEGFALADLEAVWDAAELRIVGHHLKGILKTLEAAGIEGIMPEFDTAVAAYLLDATRSEYRLADLAGQYLGQRARHVFVKVDRKTVETDEQRRLRLVEEADLALSLRTPLAVEMASANLMRVFDQVDLPLVPILAEMEQTGITVDVAALERLSEEFDAAIKAAEESVHTLAGETFNVGSPKQLQTILFEKMGLKASKKTKTGYSTDSAVLEQLAVEMAERGQDSTVVQGILDYRELTKLKATYTDALLALRDPATGRVHTTFNQTVAATGRLSSSEPNLQNIPIRKEIGQEIRKAFVPAPGKILVSADYSQIELRVMAHVTGDPELMRAFAEDEDIHTITASRIFNVPLEEVTSSQRRDAKTVNFAVLYGQSDFGLSGQLKISRKAAKEYIEAYFARFPSVKHYIESTLREARDTGYVRTLLGRRRPSQDVSDRNHAVRAAGERAAVNAPIQGTSADIIKLAMIHLREELRKRNDPATLLLQVHDELVLETDPANVKPVADLVRTTMENAFPMRVRLKAEVKAGKNWQEMTGVE